MAGRAVQSAGVTAWRSAVVAAYAFSGPAFATWVSRLPARKLPVARGPAQ